MTMRSMRRAALPIAVALLSVGPGGTAARAEEPVPDSCKLHPTQLVNPGCVPAVMSTVEDAVGPLLEPGRTYPNLVPNVTEVFVNRPFVGFDPETGQFTWGPPELWFDTYSQNLGAVPLDLMSDDPTNVTNPPVSQCVSWTTDFVCRERVPVGGFELHPTHFHFHFQNFAKYELRAVLADGTPDWSAAGLLGASDKVSFCLVDSTTVRADARPTPSYVLCGATREGISPGWADIYTADLDGQQIPIGHLPDGRYALVIEMDYGNDVYETDDTDNRVAAIVDISNDRHDAAIVSRSWS